MPKCNFVIVVNRLIEGIIIVAGMDRVGWHHMELFSFLIARSSEFTG